MKKSILIVLAVAMTSLFISSCCVPEIISNVPNRLRPQETNNWCWAATTQMLAQHFGLYVTQCELANHRFSKSNCCDLKNSNDECRKTDDCNTPGWLELDFAGVKFQETTTARSWAELRSELACSQKPMGYAYGTPGVVGHVVVIKGYVEMNGINWLVINDPWSPCSGNERFLAYDDYADPPGSSTHWRTWYQLEKK